MVAHRCLLTILAEILGRDRIFRHREGGMQTIRDFLADEERALTVLIVAAVGLMLVGLAVAMWAMYPFN
jgi:hypothetical protein